MGCKCKNNAHIKGAIMLDGQVIYEWDWRVNELLSVYETIKEYYTKKESGGPYLTPKWSLVNRKLEKVIKSIEDESRSIKDGKNEKAILRARGNK